MSSGGVFRIITNDGKQDRMLNATGLLNRRLALIEEARARDPLIADSTPTLLDIEKTHILFMSAHFKPFATIGYEYQKVTPQSAVSSLGSSNTTVQFSIPQFGDFFADMVAHVKLTAPSISRTTNFGTTDVNQLGAGAQNAAAFRWTSYPGERLFQKVAFTVGGNALDEYTSSSTNMHRAYFLTDSKKRGWNRCVGQEMPLEGHLRQPGTDLTGTSSSATGTAGAGSAPVSHRIAQSVLRGPQTPKLTPDDLEMWIPLLFWFNLDPRLAVPSVAIPFGQRFITFTLATASQMYGLVPRGVGTWADPKATMTASTNEVALFELYINNIFVNPEVHDIFIQRIGFTLIRVHREHSSSVDTAEGDLLLSNMKWPIEYMCVGFRVTSYGSNNYDLDKWHKYTKVTNTAYAMNQVVSLAGATALTYTVNALSITTSGVVNLGTGAALVQLSVGDLVNISGHLATVTVVTDNNTITVSPAPTVAIPAQVAASDNESPGAYKLSTPLVEVPVVTKLVDKLTVKAHGIPLYNDIEDEFYSNYLPTTYGGPNVSPADDEGLMLINFSLYPGTYQPSGHINVSRAREFYISWRSSVISTSLNTTMFILGMALNFLLISDGGAVLRYST
jgi:hypothetical protein